MNTVVWLVNDLTLTSTHRDEELEMKSMNTLIWRYVPKQLVRLQRKELVRDGFF